MNELVPLDEFQKEIAKSLGKELVGQAFGFINDIVRPPAKELGGLFADRIKLFRLNNQFKMLKRAAEIHEQIGLQKQIIPLKLLAEILDNCAWEEDEELQKKWSVLLANSATRGEDKSQYSIFSEILRQMSPAQAKCLEVMYCEEKYSARKKMRSLPSYQYSGYLQNRLKVSKSEYQIIIDNLIRLNLVHQKIETGTILANGESLIIERNYEEVSLTNLGQVFIRKCRIPFNDTHIEKIEGIIFEKIDEIARNPKDTELYKQLNEQLTDIYEHITEYDLKNSIGESLNKALWKNGRIDDFKNFPLRDSQKDQIVTLILSNFKSIYP